MMDSKGLSSHMPMEYQLQGTRCFVVIRLPVEVIPAMFPDGTL